MAKLVYNEATGTYSIKPDSWTNGGIKVDTETRKIVNIPKSYAIFEGSVEDCKAFIKTVKGGR